ncbi:hypothetical protein ASPCADRAFT_203873 [Aspergillus carbonarius ITEM 5010]|uniref:Uncharacterized protein n=1 Tax=Aspergillus carbonarius (strain ITEM 5010) TaxID=602072 RepID=A0A1R3RZP8_ASPC5|nr:hypothetical protein ASPCADRAFT_203873 [Aspergillus carbonarius ITEM 5010]
MHASCMNAKGIHARVPSILSPLSLSVGTLGKTPLMYEREKWCGVVLAAFPDLLGFDYCVLFLPLILMEEKPTRIPNPN